MDEKQYVGFASSIMPMKSALFLQARVMIGIRENYYADQELKEWLKHGNIREFRR